MSETGANLTPDKLPRVGRGSASVRALESACDEALAAAIDALEPENVVGFGAFAAERAQRVIDAMPPRASAAHNVPSRSARMHSGRCKASPT